MKKFLTVLLILAIVAGGLSAQEFKFTGGISSGLFAHFSNQEDGKATLQANGGDGVPLRVNLTGTYANADNNAGFTFTLRGQAKSWSGADGKPRPDPTHPVNLDMTSSTEPYSKEVLFFENARGWIKGLDGKLTLTGGYWDPGTFNSMGGLDGDLGSEGTGLLLELDPLAGLKFGFAAYAKQGDTTLLAEAPYIFSASYELPDTLKVVLNFKLHDYGKLGFSDEDNTTNYNEASSKNQKLGFGINYLGLKSAGITKLALDGEIQNLGGAKTTTAGGDKKTYTPLYLGQRISFAQGDLSLDARFRQKLILGNDEATYAPSLRFVLTGAYAIGNIVPKLGVGIYLNNAAWTGVLADMRFDEGNGDWDKCIKDNGILNIRPAVEFRFGGSANVVELGYSVKSDLGKNAKATTSKSTLDQAIYATIKASL